LTTCINQCINAGIGNMQDGFHPIQQQYEKEELSALLFCVLLRYCPCGWLWLCLAVGCFVSGWQSAMEHSVVTAAADL